MKITQMRYFSTACHLGSITKAAETLYISQPGITTSIKALEEEIGIPLLYRSKKFVNPTPEGDLFLKRCDAILENIDNLVEDFQHLSENHQSISVGIPPMIGYFLFPQIFSQFNKKHPEIHIKVREAGSETAKSMVKKGELELAIITMGENELPALNSQYLGETQLMYCVDSQHRLADKTAIDMKDIDKDPLILFSMGYYHQQVLRNRFLRDHITPNILFNSNQVMTIKGFVRNAIANAFLLPQVIEEKDGIIMIPFKDPMKLNVAVIWRKDAFITKEADSFINFVSSRFKH